MKNWLLAKKTAWSVPRLVEWALYVYIFVFPWHTRLIFFDASLNREVWEYGRISLFASQLLWLGIVLLLLFDLVAKRGRVPWRWTTFKQQLSRPTAVAYWLLVVLAAYVGTSIVWSLDPSLGLYRFVVFLQGVSAVSTLLLVRYNFMRLLSVWVAAGCVQSLFGLWQFLVQYVPANKWLGLAEHIPSVSGTIILITQTERWMRVYGALPHPNILGGFLALACFGAIYCTIEAKNKKTKIISLFALAVLVAGLFVTFSRSAILGLFVGCLMLVWWSLLQRKNVLHRQLAGAMVVMLVVSGIFAINFNQLLRTRVAGEQFNEVISISLRMTFTEQAMELLSAYPVSGVGVGNYTLGVFFLINHAWPGYYYQPVHSLYWLVLVELGVIGAGLFILFIFGLLRAAAYQFNRPAVAVSLAMLICLFVIGLFDHYMWSLEFGVMLWWLVVGLLLKESS